MRTKLLVLLLFLFMGSAGAVTIGTPVYNNGHSGGDKFPGVVQVNDLIVDDDAQIGDDAAVLGDLAVAGAISAGTGTLTGVTGTFSGIMQAEHFTSTDDITVYDRATVDELYVNETSDFLQEAEFSVAIDMTSYETAVDTGISDSNIPGLYFVGNASANQTLTLPAAASADGCSLKFIVKANVGSYNVVIDGDDAETINGAGTKTNSDQYSMLEVTSDGTAWYISDSIGTWT